ncbi:non-ribosomal peptide synthetase [Agarilytica rhodophyticola]|uniref:non-ribosomal peptide synthetase n=1 Tax=Agarilytica rhodophyticola TaxID=1737490 RepID=UPI000B3486FD|nr:condensation domain-containing protein [Agarilytica rhodophyticola]
MTIDNAFEEDDLLALLLAEEGFDESSNTVVTNTTVCQTAASHTVIAKRPNLQWAPMSFSQQRLWVLDQLEANRQNYVIPRLFKLSGNLDVTALTRSFKSLTDRHEVFRTSFSQRDGETVQVIHEDAAFVVNTHDLRDEHDKKVLHDFINMLSERPFNLSQPPLLRADLITWYDQEFYLVLAIHHIISDAWSNTIFLREFTQLYQDFSAGGLPQLPAIKIQYGDYAHWQRSYLQGETLQKQEMFWRQQLDDCDVVLSLPCDYPRPATRRFVGAQHPFTLSREDSQGVRDLAKKQHTTPFIVLLSLYQVLLSRFAGQNDIRVGVPVANRQRLEIEDTIGFFVNTQVMRLLLTSQMNYQQAIQQCHQRFLAAQDYQDFPFEYLVDSISPERDLSRSPLFQVMFDYKQANALKGESLSLGDLHISTEALPNTNAKFDLTLSILDHEDGFVGHLEYNADIFSSATIAALLRSYLALLSQVLATPEQLIHRLSYLDKSDFQRQVYNINQTAYPLAGETVISQFEQQAYMQPSAIALEDSAGSMTYADLNRQANCLAHFFIALKSERPQQVEPIVALSIERKRELVIAMLAAFKAGCAYLPLDPTHPSERRAFMIKQCQALCILGSRDKAQDKRVADSAPYYQIETILEQLVLLDKVTDTRKENPEVPYHPEQLAYTIFTSGSTGKPKGVQISQQALVNFLRAYQRKLSLTPVDNWLAITTIAFDIAALEILLPLVNGASVVIANEEQRRDPEALIEMIGQHNISVFQATPATWNLLIHNQTKWPKHASTMTFLSGGEALPGALAEQLLAIGMIDTKGAKSTNDVKSIDAERRGEGVKGIRLFNEYGPTEATIYTGLYSVLSSATPSGEKFPSVLPIGKPHDNTGYYILDDSLSLVPSGAVGILYISGIQLARAYLKQPKLTAAAFIPNPFANDGSRIYNSGDRVRLREDGNLEYLSRNDGQIKLHGHRIEIREIEHCLQQHPKVRKAIVTLRAEVENPFLAAYWLLEDDDDKNKETINSGAAEKQIEEALKRHLQSQLPDYMIPKAFHRLDSIPLNTNGKVDKHALPEVDAQTFSSYEAPTNPIEQRLVSLWCAALQRDRIGIDDNFFEIGGDSMAAIKAMGDIRVAFNQALPVTSIFQRQTIRTFALLLSAKASEEGQGYAQVIALNTANKNVPRVFCFHPAGGHVNCYRDMARKLSPVIEVMGIQAQDLLSGEKIPRSMESLVADYARQIKRVSPQGPYYLMGWCLGGHIALAVAEYLEKQDGNEQVTWVGVVDYDPKFYELRSRDTDDDVDELFRDFLNYINNEGINISSVLIDHIQELLAPLDYEQGIDQLIEYGLRQGYLGREYNHAQLKVKFMADKQASRLVKNNKVPCVESELTVWMTEQKLAGRPQIEKDWQLYTAKDLTLHRSGESHFSILKSTELLQSIQDTILKKFEHNKHLSTDNLALATQESVQ